MAWKAARIQEIQATEAARIATVNARKIAISALKDWYEKGFRRADDMIPKLQIAYNLSVVAKLPGWHEKRG